MNKTFSAILAALMLSGTFAVSAGACIPFPGTDLLTVTRSGSPAAEASLDLYRVDEYGDADTFLGAYTTDADGRLTASHLTTGLYRWSSEAGDVFFRITGSGFVRTAVELPAEAIPAEEPAVEEPAVEELPAEETEDGREHMTYMSADGFQLRYNALQVESRETGDHSAEFVLLDEASGADKLAVSWIAEKQPEEVLYEVTSAWGEQTDILRTEGIFPGTEDKWGYWRTFTDGSLTKCAIAGEYNGGVLLFEIDALLTGDEAKDMAVSDILAEIVDSVTYFDFAEQTMYACIPGVYTSAAEDGAKYQLILNADHTGTLCFHDTADILWGSTELIAPDAKYAYTVEGDSLYVEFDGVWTEFAREIAE